MCQVILTLPDRVAAWNCLILHQPCFDAWRQHERKEEHRLQLRSNRCHRHLRLRQPLSVGAQSPSSFAEFESGLLLASSIPHLLFTKKMVVKIPGHDAMESLSLSILIPFTVGCGQSILLAESTASWTDSNRATVCGKLIARACCVGW